MLRPIVTVLRAAFFLVPAILLASCAPEDAGSNDLAPAREAAATQPAPAGQAPAAEPDFSLTIYSAANPRSFIPQESLQDQSQAQQAASGAATFTYVPGFGVVREVRRMRLAAGSNRLEFTDVAAGIDPTTVSFRSLTAPQSTAVLEQNYEDDLASPAKLLGKYVGREVILTLKEQNGGKTELRTIRGKLLSNSGYAYIIKTDDPATPLVIAGMDTIETIRLAELKTGFVSKPTLDWEVQADRPGDHDVQVTYQTEGLTWRADYGVTLSGDEQTADVSAWVTALNISGKSYPNAKLKLVAGNVRRFVSDRARQFGGGQSLFSDSAGGRERPEFKEKSFFEYHLYTLDRPTTLANDSTKQIELFAPKTGVKVEKVYVYYGLSDDESYSFTPEPQTDREFGTKSNRNVDIYVRFINSQANGMGVPLPAGRIRVYKADPADNHLEFLGEDVLAHTPRDETVLARLGATFDLVGDRTQTNFDSGDHSATESFNIVLHNHKPQAVHVIVKESLFRWLNWEITKSSDKYEKQDSRTIHFPVDVPAGGEKKVTYTVKYTW